MKTLIIYAHPDTGGHCPEILKKVEAILKKTDREYEIINLYKIKYDPILHEDEHYTRGNYNITKQNKEFQDKIKKSKHMIFIYPIWWASMPAILKGWIDRVFTGMFAFKYINGRPVGLLKGRKAAVFTTSGAPLIFSKLFQGGRGGKIVAKDTLRFCEIKAKVFQLGSCNNFSEERIPKIKKLVRKGLNYLYY